MEEFDYIPENVCSRNYHFQLEDGVIKAIKITGGCPGNTQGVSKLLIGRKVEDVISLLSGIKCPGSKTGVTSCPDQISKALEAYQKSHHNNG